MHTPKSNKYLDQIMFYIKFNYDKENIRLELKSHIVEKIDYYVLQGFDLEMAEQLSIEDMGDAKEIGIALNKQHHPLLGWIWVITNTMLILIIIWNIYYLGGLYVMPSLSGFVNDISESDIVYRLNVNETVQLDDTIMHFTKVIYQENGDMNIFYEYYDTKLLGHGRGIDRFLINDNLGNIYYNISGGSSGGFIKKCRSTVENFSKEADTLIISYDYWNRNYSVKILLKEGENHE